MKRLHCLLLPLYLTLAAAMAEDITTTDGRTYAAATITKVEPDGLRIVHESGAAKIPFEKLPADIQQKHGYDPAKAAEFKKTDAAAQAAREAAMDREMAAQTAAASKEPAAGQAAIPKEIVMLYSHVYQVGETGILVKSWEPVRFLGSPLNKKYKLAPLGKIVIYGHPNKDQLADKDVVDCLIRPTGKTLRIGNSTYKTFQYFAPKPE